jgi:hypothetical protein
MVGLLALVQFASPWLVGYDGHFHIKFSALLAERGFVGDLPWLQFTIHRDAFRDHHLLFHYLLVPFALGDLTLGGKVAAVVFAAAMGLSVLFVYQRAGIALAPLFALLTVLASEPFLYRMSLLRVQSLALALLLLVFYLSMRRRSVGVYLLSVVFVWYYDAFPLLLLTTGVFVVADWLLERKVHLRVFVAALLGILTGMVLNPDFPQNIASLGYNVYRTLFLDVEGITLGSEWQPYKTWQLVTNSLPAFLALFATILALPLIRNLRTEEYAALCLNLVFFVLTLKSRRFVEYWPAFAMLSAALTLGRRLPATWLLAGLLVLVPLAVINLGNAMVQVRESRSPQIYEGSASWLRQNTGTGDLVFNADWDDFPFLFFYNHHNHYILGLDPMYMYSYDPDRYRQYQAVTRGQVEATGERILADFGARYVFLDRDHDRLLRRLDEDPFATRVFEDGGGYVYALADPRGRAQDLPAEAASTTGPTEPPRPARGDAGAPTAGGPTAGATPSPH